MRIWLYNGKVVLEHIDHPILDFKNMPSPIRTHASIREQRLSKSHLSSACLYNGKVVLEHIDHPILDLKNMPIYDQKLCVNTGTGAIKIPSIQCSFGSIVTWWLKTTSTTQSISRIAIFDQKFCTNTKLRLSKSQVSSTSLEHQQPIHDYQQQGKRRVTIPKPRPKILH